MMVTWFEHDTRNGTVHAHVLDPDMVRVYEKRSVCGLGWRPDFGKPRSDAPRCRACERIIAGVAGRPMGDS